MKVILLEKVARLGSVGSEVEVKAGYARNYLLPNKLAVLATPAERAKFESMRAELEAKAAAKLAAAKDLAAKVEGVGALELSVSAGSEGRLFGSVTTRDLVEALSVFGVNVEKTAVRLASPIRDLGEHSVRLHLHPEVDVDVKVIVSAE